jgi:hypothetical protein
MKGDCYYALDNFCCTSYYMGFRFCFAYCRWFDTYSACDSFDFTNLQFNYWKEKSLVETDRARFGPYSTSSGAKLNFSSYMIKARLINLCYSIQTPTLYI